MKQNKVLILTYYWPPSGGAGVQRWFYLSEHLADSGTEVHILTVDPQYASYYQTDTSLKKRTCTNRFIHRTKSFEPINIYARLLGKQSVPVSGFSNVENHAFQQLMNAIRSRLFIPDPRKYWKKFALPKALQLIDEHSINKVITTSPPHSVQLIGKAIKQARPELEWIADFRDPWTDIYYYPILNHSKRSAKKDKALERRVLLEADKIITVSSGFKQLFLSKDNNIHPEKIHVLPNGYQKKYEEINIAENGQNKLFTITYSGSLADNYPFSPAAQSLQYLADNVNFQLQLIGEIANCHLQELNERNLFKQTVLSDRVAHQELIEKLVESDILLLFIPDAEKNEGIIPGKLFEYLAVGKPVIAFGPQNSDVATILKETNSGRLFTKSESEKAGEYMTRLMMGEEVFSPKTEAIEKYSRSEQAKQLMNIIRLNADK